jgi:hypothetical protein
MKPEQPVRFSGHFWYRDEVTYQRFREIIEDKGQLASPYATWLANAEKFIKEGSRQGIITIKIVADPNAFVDWCRVNSKAPNSSARSEYAAQEAAKRLLRKG